MVCKACGLARLSLCEAIALPVKDQFGIVDEGHPVSEGELFRSGCNEVNVRAAFQNQPSGLNGISNALDTGNAPGFHTASIHEQGIKLDAAIGGKKAAATGVEGGVVFKNRHSRFHGIECGAVLRKETVAGFKRMAHASLVSSLGVLGYGPCTSVNKKRGNVRGNRHSNMVVHSVRAGLRRLSGIARKLILK